MPEFLRLLAPDEARELLLSSLKFHTAGSELIQTAGSLDRISAEDVLAPHPLPEFARSAVDGYALLAQDTYGASDSLPAYLKVMGEVPMGVSPPLVLAKGQCLVIHTGGVMPEGANAVVMLEHTQIARGDVLQAGTGVALVGAPAPRSGPQGTSAAEIEVLRAVAQGENVIQVGEDVATGQVVIQKGTRLRPAEIGGLMALGLTSLKVERKPRVGLISSGDEVIPPEQHPRRGQVRDVNAYALASAITKWGGEPAFFGIVPDQPSALEGTSRRALAACDCLVISAGSSASARDQTANVINALGSPGVLVHGINTRPGKPTILGACDGKAVLGLPGNPVSALVNAYLFVRPLIELLLGQAVDRPQPMVMADLTVNLASEAGREDWWPVRLKRDPSPSLAHEVHAGYAGWLAEPIFGRSNLIFLMAAADGLLRIPAEVTGLSAGAAAEVFLL